jgi:hypothetical protein
VIAQANVDRLRFYPEGRACRYPTVTRLLEVFGDVQLHCLKGGTEPAVVLTIELTPLQCTILRLLGIPESAYDG